MSAKDRLQKLQTALVKRGVKDVKFFFSNSEKASLSTLTKDVADFLEAILDNRLAPFSRIGDSLRK